MVSSEKCGELYPCRMVSSEKCGELLGGGRKRKWALLVARLLRHKVSTILCPKRLNSANSVSKYIYRHIWTYIHIWTCIKYYIWYVCTAHNSNLAVVLSLPSVSVIVATLTSFRLWRAISWLIVSIWSYGNVPMDRGIILCFRRKSGFDLRFSSQSPVFRQNTDLELIG